MQVTRGFGFVGVLGACWVVAAGCSSDTNANLQSDSGSGSGGSGVSSGGSGGRATGGRSGSTGTGGRIGSGGSATGGAPASGGRVGASGSGGNAGGRGGTDASASGGATDGGTPDSGDAGNTKGALSCAYRCNTDADCLTGTDSGVGGPDATYKCNSVRKRCENPVEICNSNADCMALASFWSPPCKIDGDCNPGDICVDAGGYGMCATPTPADAGACALSFFAPEAVVRQKFGSTGSVTVCGNTAGRCSDHRCSIGCISDFDCSAGGAPTCNTTSGVCECATNADCATAQGASVCNGTTHQCECATNADCAGVPGGDVCVSGTCGCSGASVCTVPFRGTTSLCE